jgi:hypothetical protein
LPRRSGFFVYEVKCGSAVLQLRSSAVLQFCGSAVYGEKYWNYPAGGNI